MNLPFLAGFSSDEDDSVSTPIAIDRARSRILQNGDVFHVIRVHIVQTHLHSIDENER